MPCMTTAWPRLQEDIRTRRMEVPEDRIDMVLDTDTWNEVDDQFALCYSLLSGEKLDVRAVYAAPFHNARSRDAEDGMEKSYAEIVRLLSLMGRAPEGLAYKGVTRFMRSPEDPVDCPAARDLIGRAMERPDDRPLYVVAIGAITDVASALLLEPRIAERIVVVWLGGHALHWPDTREFNLMQDPHAARTVFDSGVPAILVPCMGVASHMITTVHELRACLGGRNALCDALISLVASYAPEHFGWGKPLWDVAAVGTLLHHRWTRSSWEPSPLITQDLRWAREEGRPRIRVVQSLDRNAIFRDMFAKLAAMRDA